MNAIKAILNNEFDVLIHPCNCSNVMATGINKDVKDNFPENELEDFKLWKKYRKNPNFMIGNFTYKIYSKNERKFAIINAYINHEPYSPAPYQNYTAAIRKAVKKFGNTKRYLICNSDRLLIKEELLLEKIERLSFELEVQLKLITHDSKTET